MFEIIPNWHPIFVHFTVALFTIAVGLSILTPFIHSPLKSQWHTVMLWTLWFGAGFTVLTGLTGLFAYNTVAHDGPSHEAMTNHRNWAFVTIFIFFILTLWSIVRVRSNKVLGSVFVIGMLFGGIVLALTAWRGAEVVFRHGIGVMSLPKAEGEGHAHEHVDNDEHHTEAAPSIINTPEHHDDHQH